MYGYASRNCGYHFAHIADYYIELSLEPYRKAARCIQAQQKGEPMAGSSGVFCPTPRQESDEYVCTARGCFLRWDAHEEKPPCPNIREY